MTEALQDPSLPEVIDVAAARKNLTDTLIGTLMVGHTNRLDGAISVYTASVLDEIDMPSASQTRIEQVTGRETLRRGQELGETLRKHVNQIGSPLERVAIAASVPVTFLLYLGLNSVTELDKDGFSPWEAVDLPLGYAVLRVAAMGTSLTLGLPQKRAQKTLDELTELHEERKPVGTQTVQAQLHEEAGIFIRAGRKRRFRRRTAALVTAAGLLGFASFPGELLDDGSIKPTVRSGVVHDIDTEL